MSKMKKVQKMLEGKDPKEIAYWALQRGLILLNEAGEEKSKVVKYVEEYYDKMPKLS